MDVELSARLAAMDATRRDYSELVEVLIRCYPQLDGFPPEVVTGLVAANELAIQLMKDLLDVMERFRDLHAEGH